MNKKLTMIGMVLAWAVTATAQQEQQIIKESGVAGGFVVVVEPADAETLAGFRPNDAYVVQGLVRDAGQADKLRLELESKRVHGPVSVLRWVGSDLPYGDNVVNLLIVPKGCDAPPAELDRVLVPGGRCVPGDSRSAAAEPRLTKPWPSDRDEWTHYLYDASGNACSHDRVVGSPKSSQWWSGPYASRSHNYTQSEISMVSGGGRLFYIQDEGPISVMSQTGAWDSWAGSKTAKVPRLPEQWALVARDAFNGVVLWKRPVTGFGHFDWEPVSAGCWPASANIWKAPLAVNRRVVVSPATVAAGKGRAFTPQRRDLVYATLAYRGGVTALDATSGATVFEYAPKAGVVDELVLDAGRLILRCRAEIPVSPDLQTGESAEKTFSQGAETIVALDAGTARELWTAKVKHVATETLCAAAGRVCYYDYEHVVCLDAATGRELWRQPGDYVLTGPNQKGFVYGGWGAMLFLHLDKAFFSGKGGTTCFEAATGKPLWTNEKLSPPKGAFGVPYMMQVVGDRLITENLEAYDVTTGKSLGSAVEAMAMGNTHGRCHRGRATDRYLMGIMFGIEFYDIASRKLVADARWLRSTCKYGYLPANGLLYNFPDPCACWIGARIRGFNAFAPVVPQGDYDKVDGQQRLEQGPAFSGTINTESANPKSGDWPTYRHDPLRSGAADCPVSTQLKIKWTTDVGVSCTAPVIAGGAVFVADKESHRVVCLDAETGKIRWSFAAPAVVDSPPSLVVGSAAGSHGLLCIFGCLDGYVYCLDQQGSPVWRFRAAPIEQMVMANNRPTSKWPVSGAVLVQDGAVYCAAGRSSFLDGGIQLYALEPATGKLLKHARLNGPNYGLFAENPIDQPAKPGRDINPDGSFPSYADIEGARADILVFDGVDLHMGQTRITRELVASSSLREMAAGKMTGRPWLRPMNGFLDDTLFHRVGWFYTDKYHGGGNVAGSACAGSLLVVDNERVYSVQHQRDGQGRYPNHIINRGSLLNADPIGAANNQKGFDVLRNDKPAWSVSIPMVVRSLLLTPAAGNAGKLIFVGGVIEQVDGKDPLTVYEYRAAGSLWAVSAATGEKLGEWSLPAVPVWDGLAAANGRLYLSTTDGSVRCLAGEMK